MWVLVEEKCPKCKMVFVTLKNSLAPVFCPKCGVEMEQKIKRGENE